MSELIDFSVKKLFGMKNEKFDPDSVEFMKQSIKNAPNISELNLERTPDDLMEDFLFENGDLGKMIRKELENAQTKEA
tara:strand:- start:6098 stop:6331 length:234 start_codon:yes stop_codon:yes gene_type:complete